MLRNFQNCEHPVSLGNRFFEHGLRKGNRFFDRITPVVDNIQDYKRNWIRVNRMPCNRLPRLIKSYTPKGRRNQARPLKRLLDA
jgi:hypothetical protein